MFRFMRPRKTIFSLSRLPLRLEAQTQRGQTTNVQKVHFKKPGLRPRNIAISCLTIYVCVSIYSNFVLEPLEQAAQEAIENMPADELDEEDIKPFFIPFPGTTKQLPPQPYRGSDPEWQEFIKFSKDQNQAKGVRDQLANYIRSIADTHPILNMRCGKGMKLRRYWLDVDFPTHAPPEFVRSGIEITDEYVAWAQAPVDSHTVFRMRQALWPSALAKSFWTFTKVMVIDDVKRIAGMLGIQQAPPPPLEQIIARHQQLIKNPSAGQQPNKDGLPQAVSDPTKALPNAAGAQNVALTGAGKAPGPGEQANTPATSSALAVPSHFINAMMAFRAKLSQTWKPAVRFPPRGSIIVSGFVELDAPKAWLVFDVKAAWDPKTKEFDTRGMFLKLRRMQLKKQGPAGGV